MFYKTSTPYLVAALHLFKQYLTSPQFLGHTLRHTMSHPHVAQDLLGKCDLLPLKDI